MKEVQVDIAEAFQGLETGFAVGSNRFGTTVRNPRAGRPRHASLRHDPRVRLRAAAAKPAGQSRSLWPSSAAPCP